MVRLMDNYHHELYPATGPMPEAGPKVVAAATIIIFRSGREGDAPEFLMVQRAKEMRFAGGAAVFPGGRVDPSDRELAAMLAPDADPEVAASRVAGIRETLEETGLVIAMGQPVTAEQAREARKMLFAEERLAPVLDQFGWQPQLDALTYYAHWCPPMDKAFDTRFFIHDIGTGAVDIAVDATENTRLFWAPAQGLLDMQERGEISMIFPTMRNVERLAQFANHTEAAASAAQFPPRRMSARRETIGDEDWVTIPEGRGYPITRQSVAEARRGGTPFKNIG
jgi:8-oxo-dGTP pyrophosphatase MutT (NUDIX family)